jgi:VWFA-related protein
MNRRSAMTTLLAAGAGSWCSKAALAAPSTSDDFTIHSDVKLVLLDVSVTDSHGRFVSGLPQESFRVLENGRPQQITVFENRDIPVTVGLIVDESRSMTPKRPAAITAAEVFIAESNPNDQIFVLNFNDDVRRGLPASVLFSDRIEELRSALDRGRPQGKTALNDAIIEGIRQLEEGRRQKKMLVVISDGGDNASHHRTLEMFNIVEDSVATIYTIGLFEEEDPDRNPGVLKRLAAVSGGDAYFPPDAAGTIPVCRKIAKDIRARYTVGYVPPAENGKGRIRYVGVEVSAPGQRHLHARTRTRYRY